MHSFDERTTEGLQGDQVAFLIFQHAPWRFGVEVDQVEALIGLPAPPAGQPLTCDYQGQQIRAHPLDAWLGLDETGWQPARILLTRCHEGLRAFLVDVPHGILTLPVESVYPMPALVARALGASPVWGVANPGDKDGLILLLDLAAGTVYETRMAPGTSRVSEEGES